MKLETAEKIHDIMMKRDRILMDIDTINHQLESLEGKKIDLEKEMKKLENQLGLIKVSNEDDDEPLEIGSKLHKCFEATISENKLTRNEIKTLLGVGSFKHVTRGEVRNILDNIKEIRAGIEQKRIMDMDCARAGRIRL